MVARGTKCHRCAACGAEVARYEASLAVDERGALRPWRLCTECAPVRIAGAEILWGRGATWRGSTDHSIRGHDPGGWDRQMISVEEGQRLEEKRLERQRIEMKEQHRRRREWYERRRREASAPEPATPDDDAWDSAIRVLAELCVIAGKYAIQDEDEQWPVFRHISEALAAQAADLMGRPHEPGNLVHQLQLHLHRAQHRQHHPQLLLGALLRSLRHAHLLASDSNRRLSKKQ